jgi:hypothetical protein
MKTAIVKGITAAALLIGGTLGMAQVQEKGINVSTAVKYKVVKMPRNIIDADYNTDGKPRKPSIYPVYPLDDLSAEGWELVTVTPVDTGEFICFLKKRR